MMNINNRIVRVLWFLFLFHGVNESYAHQLQNVSAFNKKISGSRHFNPFAKHVSTISQESLDALHLVGMLRQGSKVWALIALPDGSVKSVKVGDQMGLEHGLIKDITMDSIEIQKTVKNKQGLSRHSMFMYLRS